MVNWAGPPRQDNHSTVLRAAAYLLFNPGGEIHQITPNVREWVSNVPALDRNCN